MKLLGIRFAAVGFVLVSVFSQAPAQTNPDSLKSGFENPPPSAHPRVWWHWMNGNITKEGIKLDLEWMHRVGIAGFQNFDAALNTPQVVEHRLSYMTPEWKDAFKYAVTLGNQLGLEEAIAGSPGWSESGGPWVPPAEGMKKYVWSATAVEGGKPFTSALAHPPSSTGAFQGMSRPSRPPGPGIPAPIGEFYADAAVVAYRRPASDVPLDMDHVKITASGGSPDFAMLRDGDLQKTTKLPIPAVGESSWIQFEFPAPTTIRSITYAVMTPDRMTTALFGIGAPEKMLLASDDGKKFSPAAELPVGRAPETTVSFPAVTAKYFRITFKRTPPTSPPVDAAARGSRTPPTDYEIAELELHTGSRVNRFEEKAAFVTDPNLYILSTPAVDPADAVAKNDIIDLTAKMHPDGTLDWTPPPGDWVVLRFGYSLLGITNHPATAEATGLEVDKMDRRYVKKYMDTYLDSYKKTVGPDLIGKRGLHYVVNDSWEAGAQNWTDNMIAQFKKLRGYDPLPWMPVLAGQIVQSSADSDRFLWDFRKTIADLVATEHYGQLETTLHEWGMGHYGESHEEGRALIADGMEVKKMNEIPMSAMWVQLPGVNNEMYRYDADDRESASVAHIYGQNLAAAESMTSCTASAAWAWSPSTLRPTADMEFINGINRIVVHESAHQPLINKAPGMTLGPCGQWFNRNETWAEQARPWVDYLSRTSFMLQQGHYGADLIYFYGEDSNLTSIFVDKLPNVPAGYGFDYVNADALIHELSTVNGRITTPGGTSYRLLGLDPFSRHMSLPVLRAIHKLVENGAAVAGPKPIDDPSLADDQKEFSKLNDELFGDGSGVHHIGKGVVYAGQDLGDVFKAMNVAPDFDSSKPEADTRLLFAHRKLADGDVYFVDNRNDRTENVDATFRVSGKAPELWHADTGKSEPASYKIVPLEYGVYGSGSHKIATPLPHNSADDRTTVPLKLEPYGSVFVVFRKPATAASRTVPITAETVLTNVEGPWSVNFQPDRGAPPSASMDSLSSWSDSSDPGIKYFSGTGTYTKTIDLEASALKGGAHLWIDLGDVKNLAEVTVNGKPLGVVWHAPYRVDATTALKPGKNQVAIKVTNAWVNRLIGDEQPNAVRITFADTKPYNANSPLLPSGLLGPVRVVSVAASAK